jgi:hypothetical protein
VGDARASRQLAQRATAACRGSQPSS